MSSFAWHWPIDKSSSGFGGTGLDGILGPHTLHAALWQLGIRHAALYLVLTMLEHPAYRPCTSETPQEYLTAEPSQITSLW